MLIVHQLPHNLQGNDKKLLSFSRRHILHTYFTSISARSVFSELFQSVGPKGFCEVKMDIFFLHQATKENWDFVLKIKRSANGEDLGQEAHGV